MFMLYGVDIMYDINWKPYLLEVNHSPQITRLDETNKQIVDNLINNFMNIMTYMYDHKDNRI